MEHIPCALCKCAEIVVNASCIVYCDLLYRPLEQKNIFTTVDIIIVFMKFWAPFVAENNFSLNQGNTNCIACWHTLQPNLPLLWCLRGKANCIACWHTLQPNLPLLWCLRGKAIGSVWRADISNWQQHRCFSCYEPSVLFLWAKTKYWHTRSNTHRKNSSASIASTAFHEGILCLFDISFNAHAGRLGDTPVPYRTSSELPYNVHNY